LFLRALVTDSLDCPGKPSVDFTRLDLRKFVEESVALQKTAPTGFLADFSPAGSVGKVDRSTGEIAWGGKPPHVANYASQPGFGTAGVPTEHPPSNPKAFLRPPVIPSERAVDHVSPLKLARTIGLTEGDRKFMLGLLGKATRLPDGPRITVADFAQQVFAQPAFADVISGEVLPDRDEFKDRLVAAVKEALDAYYTQLKLQTPPDWNPAPREAYTSTPRVESGREQPEVAVVPTTACFRCHDVREEGKRPGFSPIPMLAFDPFNATARAAWVKSADPKRKLAVLSRMLKRLATDKDMPPEDSAEAELFRGKDPAAF